MELKTEGYQGKERRSNGKLKLSFSDWRWLVVTFVTLLVGGVIAWTTLKADVEHIEENAEELKEKHNEDVKGINGKLETLVNLLNGQAVAQGKIQATMEYIQKDISEIKAK